MQESHDREETAKIYIANVQSTPSAQSSPTFYFQDEVDKLNESAEICLFTTTQAVKARSVRIVPRFASLQAAQSSLLASLRCFSSAEQLLS